MSDDREQAGTGSVQTFASGLMMQASGTPDPTRQDIIGTIPVTRADLLKRVERWTQGRKISLCRGLCDAIVTISEVVEAHGLAQDEIDRWMEAYKGRDFEALKAGYRRKGTAAGALSPVPNRSGASKSNTLGHR